MIRHIVTASLIALGGLAVTAHAEDGQGGRYTPEQKMHAATASSTTMLCFLTMSTTRHSMLARHSLIRGARTMRPGTAVRLT